MDYNFTNKKDADKFALMVNTGEGIQYCEVWEVGENWEVIKDKVTEKYYFEFKPLGTPPTLTPYAVVIPEIYQWAFPQDKFILGGFEIPLDTHNNDKVVNIAYFMWSEFRAELDSGKYEDLKRSLMSLWDYVELQVNNQNLVVL